MRGKFGVKAVKNLVYDDLERAMGWAGRKRCFFIAACLDPHPEHRQQYSWSALENVDLQPS
jgi:hypothetical protein